MKCGDSIQCGEVGSKGSEWVVLWPRIGRERVVY